MTTGDTNNCLRPATQEDALAMAELVNYAGEGMPVYLWQRMRERGQTVWDVGQQRAKRDSGGFSYRNTTLAEVDGRVVAALIGYPLALEADVSIDPDMPPMFVPLQELENLVPATWYINVLATYPDYRNRGFGRLLLERAERHAIKSERDALSLIVSDSNSGARRLYERVGFAEVASRPIVKDEWECAGQNWILLRRSI